MRPLVGCGRMFYDVRSEDTFVCGTVGICEQCRRELLAEMLREKERRGEETSSGSALGGLFRWLFGDRYGEDLHTERRQGRLR